MSVSGGTSSADAAAGGKRGATSSDDDVGVGDEGAVEEEDMEAALKKARQHLAGAGQIARALAKANSKEAKAKGVVARAPSKPGKGGKGVTQVKRPCTYFIRTGTCALAEGCP